jgi:hypothetical protein
MMKKYIEYEKAVEGLCDVIAPTPSESYIVSKCIDKLGNMPAADVREVVHAKWINTEPYTTINGKYLKAQECSNCYAFFVSNGNEPYSNHPYCCKCGATMDLE